MIVFLKKLGTVAAISSIFLLSSFAITKFQPVNENFTKNFCGNFVPVIFEQLVICVSADYYQENNIRKPVGLTQAKRILEKTNSIFPTKQMVDSIYKQAHIKLSPTPLPPGPQMTSTRYAIWHDKIIDQQLESFDTRDRLIAGHKKDIVGTNANGTRIAIYGWHRQNGVPIQPYSTIHGSEYADYSHGLRLVSATAWLNGKPVDLREYLKKHSQ